MSNYEVEKVYDENIRKLENSDPASAEEVFNPLIQKMANNTAYIKSEQDKIKSGETAVGDSLKFWGKEAEEYLQFKLRNSLTVEELNDSAYPENYEINTNLGKQLGLPSEWVFLKFFKHVSEGYGTQIAYKMTAQPSDNWRIKIRISNEKTWGEWQEVFTEQSFIGAGGHNSIYRGKNLGSKVTSEQFEAIKNGKFTDLYIGDYWLIDGVIWRIAGFDYYLNSGDINCIEHHIVLVSYGNLYNHVMNDTNTTEGGYKGSKMRVSGLNQAKDMIKRAFGEEHILNHRILITSAVSNGRPSAGSWVDSEVELLSERMVYGNPMFSSLPDGSSIPYNYQLEHSQLPLFAINHSLISNRGNYWLRDIVTASDFTFVYSNGYAGYNYARNSSGVRPYFCLKG